MNTTRVTDSPEEAHDWNTADASRRRSAGAPQLHDETLRDGLQNPSVVDPDIGTKIELLHALVELGVDSVNVGLPGAGPRTFADTVRLCREIGDNRLPIKASCAGRTVVQDLAPMVEVTQQTGVPIEAMTFIGSSPIRQLVESWSVDLIRDRTVEAIRFAVREGMEVTYVTEDTTRTPPTTLEALFHAAIDAGAYRLCLCDTVGHATPDGAHNLVSWTRRLIDAAGAEVGIDWHGHNDRGFALLNTLSAFAAGADRLHGCLLGLGERVGNAPLELLILNLSLDGVLPERDRGALTRACEIVADGMHAPVPLDHPLLGTAVGGA